jgi:hypothetical protein
LLVDDDYFDNPAGRLYAALAGFQRIGRANLPARDTWVRVLAPEGTPKYSPAAFAALARLVELPDAVREAVEALDIDGEQKRELVEDLDKIENSLQIGVRDGQSVQSAVAPFASGMEVTGSAAARSLLTCARRLHRDAPEPVLPPEQLPAFADEITKLMAEVQSADLEPRAKFLLLHHLHALLQAIQYIRITGTVPIEEHLDAFSGALSRQPRTTHEVVRASFIDRLKGLVRALDTAVRAARGVQTLAMEGAHFAQQGEHLLERGIEQAGSLLG